MKRQPERKIYVGIPTHGWVHHRVVEAILHLSVYPKLYELRFDIRQNKPVDNVRNMIIGAFLQTDFDVLLMMDTDNPPLKPIFDLVELDKDIVGFPTPIWYNKIADKHHGQHPVVWNGFQLDDSGESWREHGMKQGLQEIDAVGTGCILIARRVLEHPKMKPAFYREWTPEGTVKKGSDLLFCKRAKEAGFRIWTHYDYPCSHFKEVDLAAVYQSMRYRDIAYANNPNINSAKEWDGRWKERGPRKYPTYDVIIKKVRQEARKNGGSLRVLDFGCGRGDLMARLAKLKGVDVCGVDISKEAIRVVESRGLKGRVGSEPKGKFDVALATEVLEHLDDDSGMLRKLHRCAPTVIYSVPNNCLPPGLEPEHRRVYDEMHINQITPHIEGVDLVDIYLVVTSRLPKKAERTNTRRKVQKKAKKKAKAKSKR